ncbi:MAG: hypothetical protein LBV34_21645 [Nocardiopsaceae bacterium]|nr:hypothetical protein [Nocardiopsaceae bacterium]
MPDGDCGNIAAVVKLGVLASCLCDGVRPDGDCWLAVPAGGPPLLRLGLGVGLVLGLGKPELLGLGLGKPEGVGFGVGGPDGGGEPEQSLFRHFQ